MPHHITDENWIEVYNALLTLKQDPSCRHKSFGICSNLTFLLNWEYYKDQELKEILKELWLDWEHYSGNGRFPISAIILAPNKSIWASAEISYDNTYDLWDLEDEYCQRRWQLLDHLIMKIDKLINA